MGCIIQLSDVHFGAENKAAVAAATAYCQAEQPDLVLITGDITQQGYRREFEAAAGWLSELPDPVFVIVGNHDVPYWSLADRVFHPWQMFEQTTGHPAHDHEFVGDGFMVRGVTTARGWQARPNWSKGVIDLEQTQRAAQALKASDPSTLRILACHHPLVEMIGAPMTGEVKRGPEAAQIFAEARVDLIMTGHVHVPFALPIGVGITGCHAVGCGTLSERERGFPPSFNVVTWDDANITVTAMGWVGSGFEPMRTWHLERRRS
ncbi:metallophosphoesterase family protein [Brevundimonas aveniformis]|uniref:metallophosphoesterase family protein n=1 Tax=Brevundimonas aveniformis TaxID=370977 RepID=UPI0003FDEBD8|nr:metallophosphoesterase [Brevundimonas aveniformis]